jgi:hypothetical protein
MKWTLVAQGGNDGISLNTAIRDCCSGLSLDRLDVAVAYATLQGVKALAMAVDGIPAQSRWVIGLDDAISQPKAIDYLMKTVGSSVRLAKMSPARRFHPKLYSIWSSTSAAKCVSAIGSGNMTLNGMRKNGETAVILSAESKPEADELKAQWQKMWALGANATPKALADYQFAYDIAKKYRRKIVETGVAPPEPEPDDPVDQLASYDGDPASAQIAWLEAGSPSAGGRDLEFPKAMMPFFGLKSSRENRKIRVRGGAEFILTFTERTDNQMWRLLFSSAAIQASIGRDTMNPAPKVNRSDLIVVFHKTPGSRDLGVELAKIGSPRHIELRSTSNSVGGVFRTRNPGGREYGFS